MASFLAFLGLQLLGPEIANDIGLLRAVGGGRRRRRRRHVTRKRGHRRTRHSSRPRHRRRTTR